MESMKNISKHFLWTEADCHSGVQVPEELKNNVIKQSKNLEVLRFALGGIPIHINSWYRTKEFNATLSAASPNSQHLLGKATDIWILGTSPITLYSIIEALIRVEKLEEGGLGLYNTFVHYDNRGIKSRWNYSTIYNK